MRTQWQELYAASDIARLREAIEHTPLWEMPREERKRLITERVNGDGGLADLLICNTICYCMRNGDFHIRDSETQDYGVEPDVLMETLQSCIINFVPQPGPEEEPFLRYFRHSLKTSSRRDREREAYQRRCGMDLPGRVRRRLREIMRVLDSENGEATLETINVLASSMRVKPETVSRYLRLYRAVNCVSLNTGGEEGLNVLEIPDPGEDVWERITREGTDEIRVILGRLVSCIEAIARGQTRKDQGFVLSRVFLIFCRQN